MKPILPCLRLYRPESNGNEAQGKHGRGKDSRNGGAVRERAASFCGLPSPILRGRGNPSVSPICGPFFGKMTLYLCRGQNASQEACGGFGRGTQGERWRGGSGCAASGVGIMFPSFAGGRAILTHPFRRAWGCVGLPHAGNLHQKFFSFTSPCSENVGLCWGRLSTNEKRTHEVFS